MSISLYEFDTSSALDVSLTSKVVEALEGGIHQRGVASLVVAGGLTSFLRNLSEQALSWANVYVTVTNDRCVMPISEHSHAFNVTNNLVQNLARDVNFVPLYIQGETQRNCQHRLINHRVLCDTYDVVILGMGGDGHTAAIFPEAIERDQALNANTSANVLLTNPVTSQPLQVTQTLPRLLNTRSMFIKFSGEQKYRVFDDARAHKDSAVTISHFLHQEKVPVSVFRSKSEEK